MFSGPNPMIYNIPKLVDACEQGDLGEVKNLLKGDPNLKLFASHSNAFVKASGKGKLEVIQWIEEREPEKARANSREAFEKACEGGHLEVVKWFYNKYPELNIPSCGYRVFDTFCRCNEKLFCKVCKGGHLEVAKFLHEKSEDMDIAAFQDKAFKEAYKEGHLEVVKWIASLRPYKYFIDRYYYGRYYYRTVSETEEQYKKRKHERTRGIWLGQEQNNILEYLPIDLLKNVCKYI
jgi:hypothetical protein